MSIYVNLLDTFKTYLETMNGLVAVFTSLCILCLANSSMSPPPTCTWLNPAKMYLNKRFDHHSMTSIVTSSINLCLDTCMYRTNCFSINYERDSKTCELLKVNSTEEASPEVGYAHVGLEEWNQIRYLNPCSSKPCGVKQFCVPVLVTETLYDCRDIDWPNLKDVADNNEKFEGCEEIYLVTGPYGVPDDQLTASSVEQNNTGLHGAHRARLNYESSWDPGTESEPYIQVRFNKTERIIGVATQGSDNTEAWVEQYNVAYSINCEESEFVLDYGGETKMFEGNFDSSTPRTNYFVDDITARCVRIYPTGSHGYIVMRFDVLGCA